MSHGNHPENQQRRQPDEHSSHLEVTALPTQDRAEAFLQELRAGTAPLERIIPIAGEIPHPSGPGRPAVATVPFLTVPTVQWSKVTTGDSIGALVGILQERGGLWLAKHISAMVEWTVGPATHDPSTAGAEPTAAASSTWIRVDFQFVGAWNGQFALATPVSRVARTIWPVALSPIIGVLPDEIANKALPPTHSDKPVTWDALTKAMDNALHVDTQPSEAIRTLIQSANLPGPERWT